MISSFPDDSQLLFPPNTPLDTNYISSATSTARRKIPYLNRILHIKIPSISLQPIKKPLANIYDPKSFEIKSHVIKRLLHATSTKKHKDNAENSKKLRLPEFRYNPIFAGSVAANVMMCKKYINKKRTHSHSFSMGKKAQGANKGGRNRIPSYVTCVGISKMPIHLALLKRGVCSKKEMCDIGIQCGYEQ
eukprot:TRINITY_DN3629_c0_g1_i1.p1 TRINITY_DN3629_c0_g1~~TRINITY_DN3629_c0_g1_i1.p1  ORF type:complete len:190 (+),score=22.73 TRINITY_DN3629_c0_g1_i1:54-623(+)